MEEITGDMKVAEVLHRCPDAVAVFLSRGCPDMESGFFSSMARRRPQQGCAQHDAIRKSSLTRAWRGGPSGTNHPRSLGEAESAGSLCA